MVQNQPYNFHYQVKTEINYFFCSVLLSFKHTMDQADSWNYFAAFITTVKIR